MAKRPDMQVVGSKIAHLRREKGLCAAAFAREIEQPTWLVMLLESAHTEQSKQLIDLLPDAVIEDLLREIREVYGVSHYWLTTRYQSPKHPPLPHPESTPEPMLLPIAFTPEDAMAFLDCLMGLAFPKASDLLQHDSLLRQSIKSVAMLIKLQVAHLKQNGQIALAEQFNQQINALLDQHLAYWTNKYNITDLDLEDSTSA